MRAIAGAFRRSRASGSSLKQGGYAALVYVFVVFGLVSVGILFAPNLLPKLLENKREIEEQRLTRVGRAFEESVQRTLMIPGQKNWSTQVMAFAGMDQTEVEQTDPAFAGDPNLTRVYLIDPGLSGSLLPYVGSDKGLSRSQTNLFGPAGRVMIVSNTKRGLILPISSGLAASTTAFENIWNWTYDPQTKAPPAGWPREWNGNGNFLHVLRLNLANSFQRVTFRNLRYGFSPQTMTNVVTGPTTFQFLRGTPLALAATTGGLKRLHVVNRDVAFDFTSDAAVPQQSTLDGNR